MILERCPVHPNLGLILLHLRSGVSSVMIAQGRYVVFDICDFECAGGILTAEVYLHFQLYTPGPDQTLENFIVHLRNRQHRANVSKRIAQQAAEAGIPPADPQPSTS
jgi:hypothetical protein